MCWKMKKKHMESSEYQRPIGKIKGSVVNKDLKITLKEYTTVSDRIVVRFNHRQLYALTSEAQDEEVEMFYSKLDESLVTLPNIGITPILGDFNVKIGVTEEDHDLMIMRLG